MRRLAFITIILSLFTLLLFLNTTGKTITSPNDLERYQPNQKLLIKGIVTKETQSQKTKTYHLDNELSLRCDSACPNLLNKNITATTILEKFNNKNYLKILEIQTIN